MQLESLAVFCDVVRHASFSQAALANHISQSAVSQIVSQIESRLDVQLIDRSSRPLKLTAPGRIYYEGCREIVDRYQELEAALRNAQTRLAAKVQVAAIYSVGLGDMGQRIEEFKAQQPHVQVHMEYLHPDRVYERVLEGAVDFGLVSFPRRLRELQTFPWREEEMVLACAPQHRLAEHAQVRPIELHGEKYVGFDRDLVIRREVDRFLREQGVAVEVTIEFDNIENIKKAIEVGAGVALLPEPTLAREVEAGTLVALPLAGARLVRPLGIIRRRQHKLSTSAQRFLDLLRQPRVTATGERTGQPFANGHGAHSRRSGGTRGRPSAGRVSKRTG